MSIVLPASQELADKIDDELNIQIVENKHTSKPYVRVVRPYKSYRDRFVIPFSYACSELQASRRKRSEFRAMEVPFNGTLRPHQAETKPEVMSALSKHGSCILQGWCAFGKTCCAVNFACTIGLPTLIITPPLITLMKQWKKSVEDFAPSARVEIIEGKSEPVEADFYIVSAANMEKKGHAFFNNIGFVVVDELHKVMAEKYAQGLLYVHPRYLLGLSATPYRLDELDAMIEMYFTKAGSQCMVVREQERPFQVNCIQTGLKPKIKINPATRKVDWSSIVEWQATHEHRNHLIVSIVLEHPNRSFLILVKLTSQADILKAFLEESGLSVASLIGNKQDYDKTTRVLIGTIGKIGTGFDDTRLDSLILGTSVKNYFRQYVGRVFRLQNTEPVVFDLVDNHAILERHFQSRVEEYISLGGVVRYVDA